MDENSPLELYDLSNDIGEENNIAEDHPHIVENLNRLLVEARTVSPNSRFNFPRRGKSLIKWEKSNKIDGGDIK